MGHMAEVWVGGLVLVGISCFARPFLFPSFRKNGRILRGAFSFVEVMISKWEFRIVISEVGVDLKLVQ